MRTVRAMTLAAVLVSATAVFEARAQPVAQQQQQQTGGVGIAFLPENGRLRVARLLPNGPAERAGVKEGDVLTAIDGQPAGADEQTTARVRGAAGTEVKLGFNRKGKAIEFTIRREAMNMAPGGGGNVPQQPPVAGGGGAARPDDAKSGGVGLNITVNGNNQAIVTGFNANSPAEAAGVRTGDQLVAIDGQPLRALSDLAERLPGPVGSEVKLTVARAGQALDFTVRRAEKGSATPPNNNAGGGNPLDPAGPNTPPAAGGGNTGGAAAPPNAPAGQLPFLTVGLRLTYHAGESNIAGMHFVKDPNGPYKDRNGDRCSPDFASGQSGGVGFNQVNVVRADANLTAADVRNYLILDSQRNTCSFRGTAIVAGDGNALHDYWVHPARLAAMPDGQADDGTTVTRGIGNFGGKQVNTIAIRTRKPHYSSTIYDLATGVLLFGGTTDADPDLAVIDDRGNPVKVQGGTSYSHRSLVAVRQTNVPWAGEGTPNWAQVGKRLDYQGSLQMTYNGGQGLPPLPGQAYALSYQFARDLGGGCFLVQANVKSDLGRGMPPSETNVELCAASATFGGLWLPPRAAQQLKANQVLDEDPVTRVRTFYAGARGNVATVVQQGENDTLENSYDLNTGVMVGSRLTTRLQNNIGTSVLTFQLVSR